MRPIQREEGVPGPSSTLTLTLPGLPVLLWSGPALRFATRAGSSLPARRILDQIAERLGVMSVHLSPSAHRPTLVVVPDVTSRVRFANWLASQPDADLSRVGWLILNGADRDLDSTATAIRQAAELSSSAELVFVLTDPQWPGGAVDAATWARILSQATPELLVEMLRPAAGGYEQVEGDPTTPAMVNGALVQGPDDQRLDSVARGADPQSEAEKAKATSGTDSRLDPWAELGAGPRPWRS